MKIHVSLNKKKQNRIIALLISFALSSMMLSSARAATFYLDPVNGSTSGDGSSARPFGSLQSVIDANLIESQQWSVPYSTNSNLQSKNSGAPIKAGDTLKLRAGFHGNVTILRYVNSDFITIDGGGNPDVKLASFRTLAASRWRLKGVSLSPYHKPGYNPSTEKIGSIVDLDATSYHGPSSYIEVINNDIFSADDISAWSKDNWLQRSSSGISVDAENVEVINNDIRNIRFGITVSRKNAVVRSNRVINFGGDAIRGLGDNGLYEYNLVANAFKIDGNHDDGFQSFTRNGVPISNVTLRGNQFYYDLDHPNKSLISSYQGIGCFDGFFNNWLVENNLLYINHWHGISFYGANKVKIINNTLVDAERNGRLRPWIKINPLKESQGGGQGSNNLVRNNLSWLAIEAIGVTTDHNLDPNDYDLDALFVDVSANNFTLKANSVAVNAGSANSAPSTDLRNYSRDSNPDLGAYEFGGKPTTPIGPPGISPTTNSMVMPAVMMLLDEE